MLFIWHCLHKSWRKLPKWILRLRTSARWACVTLLYHFEINLHKYFMATELVLLTRYFPFQKLFKMSYSMFVIICSGWSFFCYRCIIYVWTGRYSNCFLRKECYFGWLFAFSALNATHYFSFDSTRLWNVQSFFDCKIDILVNDHHSKWTQIIDCPSNRLTFHFGLIIWFILCTVLHLSAVGQ